KSSVAPMQGSYSAMASAMTAFVVGLRSVDRRVVNRTIQADATLEFAHGLLALLLRQRKQPRTELRLPPNDLAVAPAAAVLDEPHRLELAKARLDVGLALLFSWHRLHFTSSFPHIPHQPEPVEDLGRVHQSSVAPMQGSYSAMASAINVTVGGM